ncbi:unnamed protein product [Rotaria magnacalcarata]|uniref:YABBY protein C-terminal domain-containing protein n=1 Tax=Rotaria magnacalcarata TaxID=392030 RepID=A0A816YXZ0_9BILA|nr:unnamed protein product [Rotaria magnacalcarata]CAF1233485.1 unnamed protein product [Rotaria magnacalcarata]CAF2059371.1 unnamed protein product [Rotaria magnacalcarata]CAF2076594.1 unnamed protein product [Rotaria magnacalcarata]CAF2179911.1 unnamed protein product [Rotaria magnacalcarata]
MTKQRQQSIKKRKPAGKNKTKSQKIKKAASKRAGKHKAGEISKRSTSTKSSSSLSLAQQQCQRKGRTQKGKSPSKFNLYMKKALPQIKHEHPEIANKDAFKKAAEQWAASPDNPKNKHH